MSNWKQDKEEHDCLFTILSMTSMYESVTISKIDTGGSLMVKSESWGGLKVS